MGGQMGGQMGGLYWGDKWGDNFLGLKGVSFANMIA